MRQTDRIKQDGNKLAKNHGHGMGRWYWQVGGYYMSTCGYNCNSEMYIEKNENDEWFLWGDAVIEDCCHKGKE